MKLGEIFKNGAVFQKGKPIRVFGKSESSTTIEFDGEKKQVEGGEWVVEFSKRDYGGPYTLSAKGDGEVINVSDIYVGEVILFSGQSNIQFRMNEEITPPEKYENDEMLRIFVSERIEVGEVFKPSDGWVKASTENIDGWSALAYLVGRDLRKKGIPAVGVIACSQGASYIQSWIDEKILDGTELDIPEEQCGFNKKHPCYDLYSNWNAHGRLYHFMLERLMPYSFGRVVWYQGESNATVSEGKIYDKFFEMMIENWRKAFQDNYLEFIMVQIANYIHAPNKAGWKEVQDAQIRAGSLPNVTTVISSDVCEDDNIHPATKWKLAARIANIICPN